MAEWNRKTFTEIEHDLMRRLWKQGQSMPQIARAVDCEKHHVCSLVMRNRSDFPRRRKQRATPPQAVRSAHPKVKEMVRLMNAQRLTVIELGERAGVARETIHGWMRGRKHPNLELVGFCLEALKSNSTNSLQDAS